MNTESEATSEEQPQSGLTRRRVEFPNVEKVIREHRTLAGAFRAILEPHYRAIPIFAQGPDEYGNRARFERVFKPWPKWVLRLGAELWHVDCPSIPSAVFFDTFRVLNVLIFRCPTDPKAQRFPASSRDVFERVDMGVMPIIFATILGHGTEHIESYRKRLNEDLASGKLTQEDFRREIEGPTFSAFEQAIRSNFAQWADFKEVMPHELTKAFEDARHQTFDKHGKRKETQLTPTYRLMVNNWIVIENMSGPKELANFLNPDIKGDAKSAKRHYARTATMCSRLGVKFRGRVKQI